MAAIIALPILPRYLYRYRSFGTEGELLTRELTALASDYIYCSSFIRLNDPMEGFFTPSVQLKARDEFADIASAIYDSKVNIGVAALSDTYDNELMWTHYADEYRGICVEYFADRLQGQLTQECTLARISYVNEPTRVSAADRRDIEAAARKILSQKKASWFYEREWRILGPVGPVHARGLRPVLRSIYLGARIPDEHKSRILEEFPNIDIWQMTIDGYDHEWRRIQESQHRPGKAKPGRSSDDHDAPDADE